MQVVLEQCPFPPQIRTDCMALLATARSGTARATHHSRPLARVWKRIAVVLGVDIATLMQADKLAWVPAHKSLSAVGEVTLSNGNRLSMVDWRANRLVDKLAKIAAEYLQAPRATLRLLASGEAASAHAACLLGIVMHAANNHQEIARNDDGSTTTKLVRDSSDKPKSKRALSAPLPQPKFKARLPASSSVEGAPVAAWKPPTPQAAARKRQLTESKEALARRVEEVGSSLAPRTSGLSGKQRLVLFAQRVRAKAQT